MCGGCQISLFQFAAMTDDPAKLREFLIEHHVIGAVCFCEECGHKCRIDWRKKMFRCDRQVTYRKHGGRSKVKESHSFAKSLVAGTWFSRSKLSQQIVCRFCCLWLTFVHPRTVRISRELSLSQKSVIDWSSFCREVCQFWLEQRSEVLGGEGIVVEIDEAKIGHRKYNRGRWIDGFWVFGGFERGSRRTFLVPVPTRDSDTLLTVIKQWIRPGTTIMSDCWRAYDCLSLEGFVHQRVNHSQNFVNPESGAHTQNIERLWREVRAGIPRYGRSPKHLVGYLAEFLFKRKFENHLDRIHAFFIAVGELYPPTSTADRVVAAAAGQ